MPEDKPSAPGSRDSWLSYGFFKVLPPIGILVGIIVFAFAAVGLYEDREWLSLDLALALGALVLVSLSWIILLKAPAEPESEESPGMSVGCALLIIAWLGVKLARKTPDVKSFLKIGIPALVVICILYWWENKLSGKDEAAADDSDGAATDSPGTTPEPTAEPPTEPTPPDPTPPEDQ